jgi:hypothetical protein
MSNKLLALLQQRHALREALEKAESDAATAVDVESLRASIETLDSEILAIEEPAVEPA